MQPSSAPVPTIDSLKLPGFDVYTRASYFAKFGKPAPPGNPARRAKAWIGSGTFWFLEGFALVQRSVNLTENDVNIEGAGPFPAFVLRPTKATPETGTSPINPMYLSLEADARALMAALKGSSFHDEGADPSNPIVYPPEENRREWSFTLPSGASVNAGATLFIQSIRGVGSPGHWDTSKATPTWVPDPSVPLGSNPWQPPMRALLPNESIQPGFGGVPVLVIAPDAPTPVPAPATGSGYTEEDRNRDNMVLAYVTAIAKQRGIVL